MQSIESPNSSSPYGNWIPLRDSPFNEDELDQRRVEFAWRLWQSQDMLLASRDRQIEENIRMIAGRQWSVWSKLLGRFVDLNEILSDKERLWRQRPVFNHLLDWFLLTHARLTENPPIIAFSPSTLDRTDAERAEVMDVIFKSLWQDCGMLEVIDRAVATLVPSGSVHLVSRVDPIQGDVIRWVGPAALEDPWNPGMERILPEVPYDRSGRPLVELTGPGENDWQVTGKAYEEHEGGIVVDAVSPLAVRGQWGHDIPWDRKRWHARRHFLTPEEVFETYGVVLEPDVRGQDAHRIGELKRLLFGAGNFGAAEWAEQSLSNDSQPNEGYCDVLELWQAPAGFPGMERTEEENGGRLLTVSRKHVLRDGPHPARFRYTSPIRTVPFINIPGRPSGSTPQESMNAIQRVYNRQWAHLLEHGNKVAHPIGFADAATGLQEGSITNEPGQIHYINRRLGSNSPILEYTAPPPLGEVVYRALQGTKEELRDRGSTEGATGRPPTRDPSGELIKELRFNSDRYIGPAARRFVITLGRMVEDWMAIIPTIWSDEKMISWAGEDQMLRTVIYRRDLFTSGSVNVTPDVESMLPEGRGERQQRVRADWLAGAFGDPQSPEAIRHYLEVARYPHMGRAHRPGGIHRVMAERENGWLSQGRYAAEVPIFEWQDHEIHLAVHTEFMSSPEYQELEPEIQAEYVLHRQEHMMALEQVQLEAMQRQARAELRAGQMSGAVEGELQEAEAELAPGPPSLPQGADAPAGRPPGAAGVPRGTMGQVT